MKDLYQCLDLTRAASQSEIKKSFRKLTAQYHPDRNPGDKAAEERFKEVTQAYDVLSDAERRKDYDEFGEISLTQGFDRERARAYGRSGGQGGGFPGGFPGGGFQDFGDARSASFDDLLSRLFGGAKAPPGAGGFPGGAGFHRGPQRGGDIKGEIRVSFLDALKGTQVSVQIARDQQSPRALEVKVPAGIADKSKIRLRGQGQSGQPPGDVVLTVNVSPSRHLERDGDDLRMRLPVTALEAYRGDPVDIPTPWGTLTLRLPSGSQSGQTLRLKGKGVQVKGKAKGDLYVTLEVKLPPAGDDALLEALERLQSQSDARADLEVA